MGPISRGQVRHKLFAMAGLALLASACARAEVGPAKYAADMCKRVALVDAETGRAINGAEDFALDRDSGRLFISAYDRRAAEKQAKKRRVTPPQSGGIYAVSLESLFDPQTRSVEVSSLIAPRDLIGGLRPHGLAYDDANHELVFINRAYERHGRRWKMTPRLQRIGANGEVFVGRTAPAHCAANDVATRNGAAMTSFDHAGCGFSGAMENLFKLKRSGLADESGALFSKASFANGVTVLPDGSVVLAATREKALLMLLRSTDGLSEEKRIAVPGGPDNVTVTETGEVIAAVHPDLFALMTARKFGLGRAPSRIVGANPSSGAVEVLFNDPKGDVFSAATVAVETKDGLVAGSVIDEGILVCQTKA